MPVVDQGRVVGMLAVGDVLKTVIQMLDEGVFPTRPLGCRGLRVEWSHDAPGRHGAGPLQWGLSAPPHVGRGPRATSRTPWNH